MSKDSYEARVDATRFEDWEFAYALLLGTWRWTKCGSGRSMWSPATANSR